MARLSIRRIPEEHFDADYLGPIRDKTIKDAATLEVDVLGLSRNGTGTAHIVEFKSKFRDKHIGQIWKLVERFRSCRPDNSYRAVHPMLVAVDISEAGRRKVWNAGIHLIDINKGVFKYANPSEDFKANGYDGVHGMHGVQRSAPIHS